MSRPLPWTMGSSEGVREVVSRESLVFLAPIDEGQSFTTSSGQGDSERELRQTGSERVKRPIGESEREMNVKVGSFHAGMFCSLSLLTCMNDELPNRLLSPLGLFSPHSRVHNLHDLNDGSLPFVTLLADFKRDYYHSSSLPSLPLRTKQTAYSSRRCGPHLSCFTFCRKAGRKL